MRPQPGSRKRNKHPCLPGIPARSRCTPSPAPGQDHLRSSCWCGTSGRVKGSSRAPSTAGVSYMYKLSWPGSQRRAGGGGGDGGGGPGTWGDFGWLRREPGAIPVPARAASRRRQPFGPPPPSILSSVSFARAARATPTRRGGLERVVSSTKTQPGYRGGGAAAPAPSSHWRSLGSLPQQGGPGLASHNGGTRGQLGLWGATATEGGGRLRGPWGAWHHLVSTPLAMLARLALGR